jgi:hypothetical protein
MPRLEPRFNYAQIIDVSERVAWRIDDLLPESASIDFSRPHLPDALAHVGELSFLDAGAKLKLNQIRGHSYMNLLAFVEEYIIAQTVRHAEAEMFGDHRAVRALLRFGEEEVKHQALFHRYCAKFRKGFPTDLKVLGAAADVARIILSKSPMAVLLTTLHLELMSQRDFTDAIRDNSSLDPVFVKILRHHWLEEAQHAKIDLLELAKLSEEANDAVIRTAFDDYFAIIGAFDGLLAQQVEMDIESLELVLGRGLSDGDKEVMRSTQRRSYRADFIGMGMSTPLFVETVSNLSAPHARRVREDAARYLS